MTMDELTAATVSSAISLLRRDFVGSGTVGSLLMPTPSIKSIKSWFAFLLSFFLPIIAAKVLPHVEPELHQIFTIAAEAATSAGGSGGSDGAEGLFWIQVGRLWYHSLYVLLESFGELL